MEKRSLTKHWIYFFVWLAAMVTMMIVYREFFWLCLPGVVTHMAYSMDLVAPEEDKFMGSK
ncbi:MAG: hypothetical protein EAY72_11410 [Bacteroidetes bacterium]|nr:MAG: hypothetical protein EAY72_11410 [Bacteroidota bacterium]